MTRKNIVKTIVIVTLIASMLLFSVSCKKDEKKSDTPIITVPDPFANDAKADENVAVTGGVDETKVVVEEKKEEPSFVPSYVEPVILEEEKSDESTITVTSTLVDVTEVPSPSEVGAEKADTISFPLEGLGYKAMVEANLTRATVSFQGEAPSISDVAFFMDYMVAEYPEWAPYVTFVYDNGILTLIYPTGAFTTLDSLLGFVEGIKGDLFQEGDVAASEETFDREYLLFGKRVKISAGLDCATITSNDIYSSEEIFEAIEIIKANYPEETKYVTYELREDSILVSYPAVDEDYVEYALEALGNLILAYTPVPIAMTLEVIIDDAPESVADAVEPAVVQEETAPVTVVSEPLVKAVETINKFYVGLSGSGDYNVTNGWFYPTIEGRVEYALAPSFSIGAKVGYAMDGYITLKGGVKYNLPLSGLYVYGDAGARIGVGSITGGLSAFAAGIGVGYEMEVAENTTLFGELGAEFGKAFTLGAKVGAKIAF